MIVNHTLANDGQVTTAVNLLPSHFTIVEDHNSDSHFKKTLI